MAKQTLLQITQEVLSSLDGDEVNSISDTTESDQVATLVLRAYQDLIANTKVPELEEPFQLTGLGDTTKPTHMNVPSTVDKIEWIKYNKREVGDSDDDWKDVDPLEKEAFIELCLSRETSDTDTISVTDFSGVPLFVKNDVAPKYFCLLDDDVVVFDSYDSAVDSTLQGSKTFCYGRKDPAISKVDTFVPDMDSNLFPAFINECKSLAYYEIRQQPHQKAENETRRQRVRWQNDKFKSEPSNKKDGPDYGRK